MKREPAPNTLAYQGETIPELVKRLNQYSDKTALLNVLKSLCIYGVKYSGVGHVRYSYFELQKLIESWDETITAEVFEELMTLLDEG